MSHELENMMYVGARPWHGLGKKLEDAPSIKEGIIYAGLDWDVDLQEIYLDTNNANDYINANFSPINTHKVVVRQSDKSVLGVVGNRYRVLQNSEAFDWFEPFVDSGMVTLESAGSLQGGKKIWVLAKINGEVSIKGDDTIEKYILLSNSHDGSMSITAGYTPIRVVCNNTLTAATSKGANLLKVRHTASAKITLEMVRDTMDVVNQTFEASIEQYQLLAKRLIKTNQMEDLVKIVLNKKELDSTRSINQFKKIMWLWENGKGNDVPGIRGTAWAGYNAFTEFFSHYAVSDTDKRVTSLWFGNNASRGKLALSEITKMVA